MQRKDNYAIQAALARQYFARYNQEAIIRKLDLRSDARYLYTLLFGEAYRIARETGDISRFSGNQWIPANSFEETLTLLDLVCDSSPNRFLSGKMKNMTAFGLQFHQALNETGRNAQAEEYEGKQSLFRRGCEALGGKPFPQGDIAYTIPVFDGLPLVIQLWLGDEEFPAQLRYLWDENANMYLKYETMYYCIGLLHQRIHEFGAK